MNTGVVSFRENAVAVLDGPDSLLKVFACNEAARQAGIEIGMTKIQAEACPGVVLRRREPEQETSAQLALLDCGYRYSPRVESTCPGTIIIDLTGAERLLGGPREIARQLLSEAEGCGFSVNVALAANPDAALHAARGFSGVKAVAAGKEASMLAPLPVEVLQPEEEILDIFESWGIRDFQSLARLPSVPLTQRLGQHGLHLQRLARGEVQRELIPAEPPAAFTESVELEESIELLEPLAFVLNRLLEELCTRLRARSLATDHLRADLELEVHSDRQLKKDEDQSLPAAIHQRTLKLPVPTQDAKVLLKLLQLDLEANPPQAPVKKVTVEVFPARLRLTQAGLFQALAPEPAKLEITLARLRATVGEADDRGRGRVGFPMVKDSHRPDDFQVQPSSYEIKEVRKIPNAPKLVLHMFRPPLAARVEVNSDDSPHIVLFRGAKAKVMHASGPWRSSGAWWDRAGQWHRDEWDVDLKIREAQGVYRIFRDFQTGQWFVEGMYD